MWKDQKPMACEEVQDPGSTDATVKTKCLTKDTEMSNKVDPPIKIETPKEIASMHKPFSQQLTASPGLQGNQNALNNLQACCSSTTSGLVYNVNVRESSDSGSIQHTTLLPAGAGTVGSAAAAMLGFGLPERDPRYWSHIEGVGRSFTKL